MESDGDSYKVFGHRISDSREPEDLDAKGISPPIR